jgi:CBS domain-containing protein
MQVSRILSQKKQIELITIGQLASLAEASRLLREYNIGVLLVTDGKDQPVGILSERDIVREFARTEGDCASLPVKQVMTQDLITCGPSDALYHVMDLMTEHRIRHVPVLDGDELVGLISIGDVVKAQLGAMAAENEQLRSYITAQR